MSAVDERGLQNIFPFGHPYHEIESKMIKISTHGEEPPPLGMRIIFINGILNSHLDAWSSAVDISQSIRNRKVDWVHNDMFNADKTAITLADEILEKANECRRELDEAARATHNVCVIIIAHSHGAAVLELTLADRRLTPLKKDIRIITIGGAALIQSLFYRSAENLINDLDLIPLIAHKTFEVEIQPDTPPFIKFIFELIAETKRKFQEEILKISSHKKPAVGDRILSAMQCQWEATHGDTSLTKSLNALGKDVTSAFKKNRISPQSSTEEMGNFVGDIIAVGLSHAIYDIEILGTLPDFRNSLIEPHYVTSYTHRVSTLALSYIGLHEAQ